MSSKYTLEELTDLFREAGAKDPESWASSEIDEGINQLARFSFLKAITSEVLRENELEWPDNVVKYDDARPGERGAQLAPALKEMLDKGVSREAIVDLIRITQFNTLFHVCCIINQVRECDTPVTQWGMFEKDDDNLPTEQIGGLHESLYEFDPSDKEWCPRS